jgi:hypothetical protein
LIGFATICAKGGDSIKIKIVMRNTAKIQVNFAKLLTTFYLERRFLNFLGELLSGHKIFT